MDAIGINIPMPNNSKIVENKTKITIIGILFCILKIEKNF